MTQPDFCSCFAQLLPSPADRRLETTLESSRNVRAPAPVRDPKKTLASSLHAQEASRTLPRGWHAHGIQQIRVLPGGAQPGRAQPGEATPIRRSIPCGTRTDRQGLRTDGRSAGRGKDGAWASEASFSTQAKLRRLVAGGWVLNHTTHSWGCKHTK